MRYLCLIYDEEAKVAAMSKSDSDAFMAEYFAFTEGIQKSGHYVSAQSLEWDTKTIRPRKGKPVVTDGPFVEAKEQVGGLVIIEARDLDEAVRIASLHPAAHLGETLGWGIDVRPIADGCHQ